jgi:hypothetical protein
VTSSKDTTTSSDSPTSSSIARTFAITYEAQNDIFSLTPVGNVDFAKVKEGSNVSFSLAFTTAYSQKRNLVVQANGTALEEADSVYTISNIQTNIALTIAVDKNQYSVTYNHDDNKDLTFVPVAEGTLPESVLYGDSLSFQIQGTGEYSQEQNLAVTVNAKSLAAVDGVYTIDEIQEDLTLHVTCDLNEYTITIVTSDESGEHTETRTAHKGDQVELPRPNDYQKNGKTYVFSGYVDPQGNKITTYTFTGNEGDNFEITAQYTAKVGLLLPVENDAYTLLDKDGQALTMGSTITIEGEDVSTFIFQIQAKTGYSQYRNLSVTAEGLTITTLDETTHRYSLAVASSSTLAIHMDINQYTVTEENVNAEGTSVTATVLHGEMPVTPTLEGYIFDHWVNASNETITAIESDMTLTAYWKKGIMTAQSEAHEILGRNALLATTGADYNESGAPAVKPASAPGTNDDASYAVTLHVDNACKNKNHIITLPKFNFSAYPETTFALGGQSWGTTYYIDSIDSINSLFGTLFNNGNANQQGTLTVKDGYLIGTYGSNTTYHRLSPAVYTGQESLQIIAAGGSDNGWTFYYGIGAFKTTYKSVTTDYRAEAANLLAAIPSDSSDSNAKSALLKYAEYVTENFTPYEKAHFAHQGNAATVEQALYGGEVSVFGYRYDHFPTLTMHGTDVDGHYSGSTLSDKRVAKLITNDGSAAAYSADEYPLELNINYSPFGGYVITFPKMNFSAYTETTLTIAFDANCWGTNLFLGDSTDNNDDIYWQQKTANAKVHMTVKDGKLVPGDGEGARTANQYQAISDDINTGKASLQITLRMGNESSSNWIGNIYFSPWIAVKKAA